MLIHLAGNWLAAITQLSRLRWLLTCSNLDDGQSQELIQKFPSELTWIQQEIFNLPFSESLRNQAKRFFEDFKKLSYPISPAQTAVLTSRIDELIFNIQSELKSQLFVVVPPIRKAWFASDDAEPFGKKVADAFPDSTIEIIEASRCLALARWTASVFHQMRAIELALHRWALQLGVNQFSAIELENWKQIIDASDKTVRQLEQQPKSAQKDAELKYYGETIAHFRAIKDAWRNHVAHSRARYDEGQATSIMNHTREFMNLLASRP